MFVWFNAILVQFGAISSHASLELYYGLDHSSIRVNERKVGISTISSIYKFSFRL